MGARTKDGFLNIFLEYVSGGSLESHIKKFKPTEKLIKIYTKEILYGLEYLHAKGVIHRDIKAANVLKTTKLCKLADFGTSKQVFGQYEKSKSFIGTPCYMAPEIIKS